MREFVDGNNEQFADLKQKLQDEKCHVFHGCTLPECCSRHTCRIGFEKDNGAYTLLIDSGITCSESKGGVQMEQFKQWLAAGELRFLDFNDLKVFLKSLKFFY